MIPIYKNAADKVKENFNKGNFGLLFNKFIDIEDSTCKINKSYLDYALEKYNNLKKEIQPLLERKHLQQYWFCKTYEKKYDIMVIQAKLYSSMITGIGQNHPSEIGMTIDHTIGVPYIPASTIKGIVRFAHLINMVQDPKNADKIADNSKIDDEEDWTYVKDLFGIGGDKGKAGDVIFLDVYPTEAPNLAIDIVNPHYQKYYSDESGKIPPADYFEPVPIKFLTIGAENQFVFRILIKKGTTLENGLTLSDLIKNAIERVLTVEGVGAKTAVGYGRFHKVEYGELSDVASKYEDLSITEEEKLLRFKNEFINKIKNAQKESNEINSLFDEWQRDVRIKDDIEIATHFKEKVKKKKADKTYSNQYQIVAKLLGLSLEDDNKDQEHHNNNNKMEDEYEKAKKKILKAKGDKKKINKVLKEYKNIRKRLEEELNL